MSQAEELLNSLSETAVEHEHPVVDTDTYFSINPNTRAIESTSRYKNVLMQYDHNSQRYTFELPRYIDGHDMSLCTSVVVNFDNIETETESINSGSYDMLDLKVNPKNPEMVISSWLISRASTQLAGTLSFSIEYKCADDEGNVTYEFGTDVFSDVTIKPRKKNSEAAVTEHVDILEQWRTKIFGAGDSVMANIAAEGNTQVAAVKAESKTQQEAVELKGAQTLDTIPEDYTEVDAMADEAVRTKADAIVCEASGESIAVADSSDDHIRGLRVFGKSTQKSTTGKNLFDANPDNIKLIDKTKTPHYGYEIKLPAGTYTISATNYSDAYLYADVYDGTSIRDTAYIVLPTETRTSTVIINDGDILYMYNAIEIDTTLGNKSTTETLFAKCPIQIESGQVATEYEPYTGGKPAPNPDYPQELVSVENPKMSIHRKNLVRTDYSKTDTYEGMTVVITKGLSEVVLNGTTTKPYGYAISQGTYLVPGRYTMSVYGLNNVDKAYLMNMDTRLTVCDNVRTGSPVTFDVTSAGIYRIDFTFAKETTYTNTTVKFQIEAGEIATEYEPIVPFETVSLNRTLPGIPVTSGGNYTDSNGQQWICDEIDLERGVYVQRMFVNTITDFSKAGVVAPVDGYTEGSLYLRINLAQQIGLCNKFAYMQSGACDRFAVLLNGGLYFTIAGEYTADEWKTKMGELAPTVVLPLATPIETPLTAEEIAAFKALKTNKPNTTILNDAGAWMSVKYNADTKTYIENPKILKLVDSSTGVVYELKVVDGNLTVTPL